jgi:acyl-CoA synthetase (AMP-forming)/AMP-acid ligase II
MTGNPLSAALAADTDHSVCFASDGSERRWPEFVARVGGIAECLAVQSGDTWALDLDDTYEFACALIGCWAAGKSAVVASSRIIAGTESSVRIDGVICSAAQPDSRRAIVVLNDLPSVGRPLRGGDPATGGFL